MIRWICDHPYWYTTLSGIPYMASVIAPTIETSIWIAVCWTLARLAITALARKKQRGNARQSRLSRQEHTLDRIITNYETAAHPGKR